MTPKKLTDCPENLREAIDWLIQVRHGNGNNGDGLTKLSQALKRLIDEAIEKAYTTNFDALLNILHSVKSYTCCKDKVAKIEALKNPKTLAKNTFNDLKDNCEGIRGCSKNHLESSQQKSYDEIGSKLQQLGELKESLTGLTDVSKCKTLLSNLCDGLEKFLGFDSATKGYTGEGIVYSDLDRLCDAVMAFLKGVLEVVKDDDAVKTYDINGHLHKLPQEINNRMYKGPHEFSLALSQMGAVLGYYEAEVKKRIDGVVKNNTNGTLYVLQTNISTNIREVEKFNDFSNKSYDEVVGQWKETVTRGLSKSVKNAELAINNLDKPLRNEIMLEFDKIKIQIDKLNESTVRDVKQLNDLARQVNFDLNELKKSVYFAIHTRVGDLRKKLAEDFTTINEEINTVSVTLANHVRTLNEWIQNAQSLVDKAIPQIEAILNEIDDNGSKGRKYPATIKKQAGELQRKADALWSATGEAKRVLEPLGQNIRSAVDTLESVYKKTLKDLQQTVQSQVHEAQRVLGELGSKVKSDLGNDMFQRPIKEEIGKVMNAFKGGIGKARQASDWAVEIVQGFREGLAYDYNAENARNTWLYKWADSTQSDLRSAVEKLGDLSKFRAVLNALESSTHDGKNFFEVITEDLYKKLTEAINAIKGELPTRMSNYNSHAKTGGTIHNAIGKVKQDVDGFFYAGGSSEQQVRQDKLEGYNRNGVDAEIKKIESEGLQHFKKFDQPDNEIKNNTFDELKSAITSDLEGLIETIKQNVDHNEDDKTGIKQKLEALQNTYFKKNEDIQNDSIYKIYSNLETLHSVKLAELITTAKTFLVDTIPKKAKECITAIKNHLKAEVTKTIENIKVDALERYVESKSQELEVLKKCVDRRCNAIKTIIDEDNKNGIKGLLKLLKMQLGGAALQITDQTKLGEFPSKVKMLLETFWGYIGSQLTGNDDEVLSAFVGVKTKMTTLFTDFTHYSYKFRNDLHDFIKALSILEPARFGDQTSTLLGVFKTGCDSLIGKLVKAYINVYEGAKPIRRWAAEQSKSQTTESKSGVDTPINKVLLGDDKEKHIKLTPDGERAAKVFLTITPIIYTALKQLKFGITGDGWDQDRIYNTVDPTSSLHALFFGEHGYDVGIPVGATSGELNYKEGYKSENICTHLTSGEHALFSSGAASFPDPSLLPSGEITVQFDIEDGVIPKIHSYLKPYAQVCHLSAFSATKAPCTVYEQLIWLIGLQFNNVYEKLCEYCDSLFKKKVAVDPGYPEIPLPIQAYPKAISHDDIVAAVEHITSNAYLLLTGIVGHGDAECRYACDYYTNYLGFKYPTSGEDCLHSLLDVLRRMHHPLTFLLNQCNNPASDFGWYECTYGKDVQPSNWQCKNHSTAQVTCQAKCQPTSPLMSYLNDCLPGHLPHSLKSVGCKSDCKTCPSNKPGMPCLTPLGFRGFSGSVKTGKDICSIINEFMRDDHISALLGLVPKAPSTLPEHFGFALSLANGLNHFQVHDNGTHIKLQSDFAASIQKQSIQIYNTISELTDVICKAYGDGQCGQLDCDNSHLVHLTASGACNSNNLHCAPYLSTSCTDFYRYMTNKNTNTYLSWVTYLPWALHAYLESLLEAFMNIHCENWGCRKCITEGNCQPGKHGVLQDSCRCSSLISCKGVMPTLYKYGFIIGDSFTLNQGLHRKSCSDLYQQLQRVLNSRYFKKLFKECDNFLWKIREPFTYLVLALWLLSLFYLLHIMVIRLDLLHIKSHLHSPSSHRIAAQSLLAAARVKALNKVLYLQP